MREHAEFFIRRLILTVTVTVLLNAPQVPARDLAHQPFVTFPVSIIRTGSARVVGIFIAKILSVRISLAGPVPAREAYLLEHGAWLPGCLLTMLLDWGLVEP